MTLISTPSQCPFCILPASRIVEENAHGVFILDGYPVSPGHTLVIPKRHVRSFFEVTAPEREALFELLDRAKQQVDVKQRPSGNNIGINHGTAAGQTVPHLHIHLIPRYDGDQADPRSGVRWVIPQKANYWTGQWCRGSACIAIGREATFVSRQAPAYFYRKRLHGHL